MTKTRHLAQHDFFPGRVFRATAVCCSGEPIVPLGLIGSHWGGTMVEMWQPNATLNAQVCKNDTGGAWAPWQLKRWDIAGGALYNGMVLPYVNM